MAKIYNIHKKRLYKIRHPTISGTNSHVYYWRLKKLITFSARIKGKRWLILDKNNRATRQILKATRNSKVTVVENDQDMFLSMKTHNMADQYIQDNIENYFKQPYNANIVYFDPFRAYNHKSNMALLSDIFTNNTNKSFVIAQTYCARNRGGIKNVWHKMANDLYKFRATHNVEITKTIYGTTQSRNPGKVRGGSTFAYVMVYVKRKN